MLTCITCAKQTGEKEEGGGRGSGNATPNTKESVKGITAQIKDMALKFSGAYKQCKPCTSSGDFKKGERSYVDYDSASEGGRYSYMQPGSTSSTPAWDFGSSTHHRGVRSYSRFTGGGYGSDRTAIGRDSIAASDLVIEDENEPKEWMAQVEPGVHITFVSLPNGGNDLKRIRFSRDLFNKWQAQRWWGENYDRIMELYNVQRFNRQALQTPARSDDEPRDSTFTRVGSVMESPMTNKEWIPRNFYQPASKSFFPPESIEHGYNAGLNGYGMGGPMEPSRTTTSSRDDVSVSNASELETEWVEQDEPGVYITIRQLADGTRELRRVRFSREKFGEVHAKTWWEQNRERIQTQYL
ncbi:unnamed protein product [Amaranthus hypochondriacus]